MVSPSQRRAAAAVIIEELAISQRKACQIVGISRTMLRRPLAALTPGLARVWLTRFLLVSERCSRGGLFRIRWV